MNDERKIAYFSMEVAIESGMPTYSGGLGVLAGDTIRAAADLKVPVVALTLLYRRGYFRQKIDPSGWQIEEPVNWRVEDFLTEMPQRTSVAIEGRNVQLCAWKREVHGAAGAVVPVYFLDADLPENSEWDRALTHFLYGGGQHYRLCQEAILGIGGVRMLRALGYEEIERFHMNEGHASLLVLELLDEAARKEGRRTITHRDIEAVRRQCVFTTHTPVPSGHDRFPKDLAERVLGGLQAMIDIKDLVFCGDTLDMTFLGFNMTHYINGVAKRHGEISRLMFARYNIDAITNGVHAQTWTAKAFQELYDRYIPGWRQDNFSLRYALTIPRQEVWQAHAEAKRQLLEHVNRETDAGMEEDILTIGFGRRAATYKRADLLFQDLGKLKAIRAAAGPFQVVYAGKAHPQDLGAKKLIQRIFQVKDILRQDVKIAYLEDYDLERGRLMTSGVDVWLNTPQPPLEASGTSGMKAALNGVPSLSVLDGWWIEGCIEGVTGWAIGDHGRVIGEGGDRSDDASSLYDELEHVVIPMFYNERNRFIDIMVHAMALNGSFFNTHRMIQQYVLKAYF
ncbi:MAG TPA: alpha-glucan family phosphorylase [Candidatus Binatia bacterium]